MLNFIKKNNSQEAKLYNKILLLSRNKLFYTKFGLVDSFQNRINLIFLHISFLLTKNNIKNKNVFYKEFDQKMFDFTFKSIELNMREIGHGDMGINKNMKFLVKIFYNILLECEKYNKKRINDKVLFLLNYLSIKNDKKNDNNTDLVEYFDKYHAFCFDLCIDSVLKGDLNFTYK